MSGKVWFLIILILSLKADVVPMAQQDPQSADKEGRGEEGGGVEETEGREERGGRREEGKGGKAREAIVCR